MSDLVKIQRRAQWLSDKVFPANPIDEKAIAAMGTLSRTRAMEIFQELEEKAAEVGNPSGYLHAAVRREGKGAARVVGAAAAVHSTGAVVGGGRHAQVVAKRAAWLNSRVFASSPIDREAVAAIVGMGAARASELLKEVEEKAGNIKNPSGYLKVAAKREGVVPAAAPPAAAPATRRIGAAPAAHRPASAIVGSRALPVGAAPRKALPALPGPAPNKVRRKIDWLNDRVFGHGAIHEDCVAALVSLPSSEAMHILGELEQRSGEVKNPSGYVQAAVRRALGDPDIEQHDHEKIRRRVAWLNARVFSANPIDDEAVGAMMGMGVYRAMDLFKEIEEKAGTLRNPSGYLKAAATREGFAPPDSAGDTRAPKGGGRAKPKAGVQTQRSTLGGADAGEVRARVDWLNESVFADNPINTEAAEIMAELTPSRAMQLLSDLEGKADQVRTPSGYVITAVARERGGRTRGTKRPLS
eukprot:CAMPEP_0170253902 /NCGR_PEP_ID=MMETSP0116_2-20130129/26795_1 /TAXON_ID=400756 /ORGANISM="Durinskia baltica, Strain CSIRO CS-38" /LENGTH=468 /DNA_ID=CAMNT_0010504893 /DNA_START=94 /DNA_END=1500 /DNA_ORIENTATION=-